MLPALIGSTTAETLFEHIRQKPFSVGAALACWLLSWGSLASAENLVHTYQFDASRLEIAEGRVSLDGLPTTWESGRPEIPYDVISFLVPQGTNIARVRAQSQHESVIARDLNLAPAMARFTSEEERVEPGPSRFEDRFRTDNTHLYPPVLAEAAGRGVLHGYQLVTIRVYPLRYDARARELIVSQNIDLEVELRSEPMQIAQRQRYSQSIEASARHSVSQIVANPHRVDSYVRRVGRKVASTQRGFRPTDAPSLEGSPVDYVIITSAALESNYQVLADWKTRRGVPTVVRTVEWIEANYRHGSDIQETIRTFISDAYSKWNMRYVLLGVDTDVIPARYGYSEFGSVTERFIPTDMYFACLDGNWNADGDHIWGEAWEHSESKVDDADMYAEVFVGRLPLSTPAEVDHVVTKIQDYENPSAATYQNKLLLLGEVLIPVNWSPGQGIALDGANYSEQLAAFTNGCENITKLYENYESYPGSQTLTRQATLDEMDSAYGIVNHIGHGFRYNMSCGDVSVINNDAIGLNNGIDRFFLYMLNCTASAFDFPCLAEAYLKADGGAVGVLGASRAAFASSSFNYNREFFRSLYQDGFVHVGEAFTQSRLLYTGNARFETVDHYTHFLYNLLGDPESIIHTCALGATAANLPSSVGLGETTLNINVTVEGLPREGALVCLQKGTEEYVWALTDVSGNVSLDFVAETAGNIDVTISGQNMTTLLDVISVDTGTDPYVHAQVLLLDDDTSGGSNGNADGVLDAGETIELDVTFFNDGPAMANNVSGTLFIDSPWATVLDAAYNLGTISSGGNTSTPTPLRFSVDANTPDGTVLPFRFETTDGVLAWTDVINRVANAPILQLTYSAIDDYAPGGNADGEVQAGETFDLILSYKNFGFGAVDGFTVVLSTLDPDVVVEDASSVFGRIDHVQEVSSSDVLRLTELSTEENILTLTSTDSHGRNLVQNITLRRPAKPATPQLNTNEGESIISSDWTPSVDSDLFGYHVYMSAVGASGPWSRVTVDNTVRVAYFRATGLLPNTEYFFFTTAMDDSGNESEPSDVSSITTAPAQQSGWPILIAEPSACPLAVGDITGNGGNEIVAGDDHLYAWHVDGNEVLDDDNDPQTSGVFADEISTIMASILVADFDPAPGLEVFAAEWASNNAFLVSGDGTIVNGWPRNPIDPGTAGYWGGPGAMDVDNDGDLEVFVASKNGHLYAWHGDGTPVGASDSFKSGVGSWTRSSVTFGNCDADAENEIIYGAQDGTLNIWNADGSSIANFPQTLGTLNLSSTAVGDVNDDSVLDVVMLTEGGQVHVIDAGTGAPLVGWPVAITFFSDPVSPSPALADFDQDGQLEIVVAANNGVDSQVYAFDTDGSTLPGWPQSVEAHTSESSPIVADFSGDGIPDIVFANESGFIFGWDVTGNMLPGFPIYLGDFIRATPWAGDADGDGDIELVLVGWDRAVRIWDFPVPYDQAAAQWPTFKHDVQRTGLYGFEPPVPTDVPGDPSIQTVPRRVVLAQNAPNPFNPSTTIAYGVPTSLDGSRVRVDVFDVRGRLVRRLVAGHKQAGNHRIVWNGKDEQQHQLESGVYFYRLVVGDVTKTRKLLLLK